MREVTAPLGRFWRRLKESDATDVALITGVKPALSDRV